MQVITIRSCCSELIVWHLGSCSKPCWLQRGAGLVARQGMLFLFIHSKIGN